MHKATTRFWKCFEGLPSPVQKVAIKTLIYLKQTFYILLFISKKWVNFGQSGLELITERLQLKTTKILFGFGSVHIKNMNR